MKQIGDAEELILHWSLNYEELEFLKNKLYNNHIAIAVQLKYYKYYGYFLQEQKKVAEPALLYIVEQLVITIDTYYSYDWNNRLARHHRQEILDFIGIRIFVESDKVKIQDWMCKTLFPNSNTIKDSLEYVYEWLHQNKVLRPAVSQLEKMIATAYSSFENSLFEIISNGVSDESKGIINYCLKDKTKSVNFTLLKSDPGKASQDLVLKEIEKLEFINQLELPEQQLTSLNTKIMSRIRSCALSETA